MRYVVVLLILALAVLHHDVWWWDSRETLFGFMPIGLAWHMAISIAAAVVGWIAVTWCWPAALDEEDVSSQSDAQRGGRS